ncbi:MULTISPECIES: TolC family protein [unclassified Sphingopyxis]|jgi:outer membrane protein, adhesin transport system|uniref:TolC family protein n=1 Tax=unclassified Sphingopyxis TaxID=2614943 RepID=UPI0006C3B040|nr:MULTISPECIES: TolC family protein [unclassified Sphingopyxis]USI76490.1 TolC family protein [Sphingopyxis sp. USTB-05]GAO76775.1 type I secretion system, outer membrane component LapE [Sphingopyxis sp. C-1]
MKPQHKLAGFVSALAISFFAASASAEPTSMQNVMAVAIDSNPQINQAEMNKQAIEFELEQAKGLYLPRVTLEMSAGVRRLENATRRNLGIANDELYPLEASLRADQTLIDFGRRHGEKLRQAARVDGAALRVLERSEFIALQSARQYLDVLLQQRVVAAAEDNMTFHNSLVSDLSSGVTAGSISVADLQQAQERAKAASVRVSEAKEALQNAKIELLALSGLEVDDVQMPPAMAEKLPVSLSEAVGLTRTRHPKVLEAQADVDAANAEAKKEKGDLFPTIGLELSGRIGDDIDAFRGETNDLLGRVVMRWDIFDGGINRAKYQEMVRRASESRFRLHETERNAEADTRRAWNSRETQTAVFRDLVDQSKSTDELLLSYREQFSVGRRSLLDVLDAQNTRFNVQVRAETARFSEMFAVYQILASTNSLLEAFNLTAPESRRVYAREKVGYGPPAPAELQRRRYPQ